MNHAALAHMYGEIERELRDSICVLLHEGRLESVAAEALVRSGASLIEGSNRGGKKWRLRIQDGAFVSELFVNKTSQIGQHKMRGRPRGTQSADLTVELSDGQPLTIEIKTRCRFGSVGSNASETLMNDLSKLDSKAAAVFILSADFEVYQNLRGDRPGKPGQKGDLHSKNRFTRVFPPPELFLSKPYSGISEEPERWHVRAQMISTDWGDRVVVILALDEPEWAK